MNKDFPNKPAPETKRKRTLFEIIIDRIKEKPATKEELDQLRLNYERAKLKTGIAKEKREAKANKPNILSLFTNSQSPPGKGSKK